MQEEQSRGENAPGEDVAWHTGGHWALGSFCSFGAVEYLTAKSVIV